MKKITKSFVQNIMNTRGIIEDEQFYILKNLDLAVETGKITALIGGNGVGKTTLFNIISGFWPPDSGEIVFYRNGKATNLLRLPPDRITRMGIGRMFQDDHIFKELTVLENMLIADKDHFGETPFVSIFKRKKDHSSEAQRVEKAKVVFQDLFGSSNPFWEKRNDPARTLSFGQQRLLGLTRLLMGNYNLVLLDEPTAGVNPTIIDKIAAIIHKMVEEEEITVFLIEHNMNFVKKVSHYCAFLGDKNIVKYGNPKDVLADEKVRRIYLGA